MEKTIFINPTKLQIIKLADELFRTKGYNAFSYSDISKPLGIKNAAIHYHFPHKRDLANQIVQFHIENFELFKEKVQHKEALSKIKFFLTFYASIHQSRRICLIGSGATDWNSLHDGTKLLMSSFTENIIQWLTHALEKGIDNQTIKVLNSPYAEALSILTNIFGATQLSRITESDHFLVIKQHILERIKKELTY